MTVYVETSAAAKLLVDEPESAQLSRYLDELVQSGVALVSSILIETELRRLAVRLDLSQALVTDLLDRMDLVEPDRATFFEAGLLPGKGLRSLDALHIAVAVRVAAESMVAYDVRQSDAARSVGLRVVAPA
ncbi:MAG: PIN domain-containing protein [Actinophytocola sp.]|nr:PIN domain-containing protein [Actinophytocola sp.]